MTKSDSILVVAQLAQVSDANRTLIEDSGMLGTSLVDLINTPNLRIQENTCGLLHYLSRSSQLNILSNFQYGLFS